MGAALVGALTACDGVTGAGTSDEAEARAALAASAEVMLKAGNGTVEMDSPGDLPTGDVKGWADWKNGSALDVTSKSGGSGTGSGYRVRVVGDTSFVAVPAPMVKLSGGKHWTASRPPSADEATGSTDTRNTVLAHLLDPVVQLRLATASGTLSTVRAGSGEGKGTRHYVSVLDARTVMAALGAAGVEPDRTFALRPKDLSEEPAEKARTLTAAFALNDKQELVSLKLYFNEAGRTALAKGNVPIVLHWSELGAAPKIEAPAKRDIVRDPKAGPPGPQAPTHDAAGSLEDAAVAIPELTSYRTERTGPEGSGERAVLAFRKTGKTAASAFSVTDSDIETWGNPKTAIDKDGHQHVIVTGGVRYSLDELSVGKNWLSMDLGTGDPRAEGYLAAFVGALAATDEAAWVATEEVGGRPAEHYRGTVVLSALAGYEGPVITRFDRDTFVKEARAHGLDKADIDVWIGRDGLVLRTRESGSGSQGAYSVTEEYSGHGADLKIAPPPANDVISIKDLLDGLKHE
ncbi:hypothetical protein OG689_22840 [Kitasatospora sp. NBC_00240]|uniref:hypothetical protein n=1 Tax=Kitasatospora sp. NBC_00240 TaxID=2903567 RepID=UPI0022563483|nr:hypothetical protein [Kitasatospora sp. NBC_00240]MCX5212081.1 hypothetical protein [Kitasatospora sp. NBC_00240]